MPQSSVTNDMVVALEGQPADSNRIDVVSKTNATRQLNHVLVATAVNSAVYSLLINDGVNAADTATYTADGSATVAEIATGLISAVDALGLNVNAIAIDSDEFYLESTVSEQGFTVSSTGDTPAHLTLSAYLVQNQEIPFGRVVCYDSRLGDDFCRLPRLSTDLSGNLALGIAHRDSSKAPNANGYADGSIIPILRKGRVWMIAEDAVSAGGAVYVRYSAGAGEYQGAVRSDADGSDAAVLSGARFYSSAGAGELVIVELNLP